MHWVSVATDAGLWKFTQFTVWHSLCRLPSSCSSLSCVTGRHFAYPVGLRPWLGVAGIFMQEQGIRNSWHACQAPGRGYALNCCACLQYSSPALYRLGVGPRPPPEAFARPASAPVKGKGKKKGKDSDRLSSILQKIADQPGYWPASNASPAPGSCF